MIRLQGLAVVTILAAPNWKEALELADYSRAIDAFEVPNIGPVMTLASTRWV